MTTDHSNNPWRLSARSGNATVIVAGELMGATTGLRTGILRMIGDPGGDFHVMRGKVVAVCSPGAPAVPDLLARTGRTPTGDAELRAMKVLATFDGAFAIAAGWIDHCFWKEIWLDPNAAADSPVRQVSSADAGEFDSGVECEWLVAETERRLNALAKTGISPHRDSLIRTECGEAVLACPAAGERQETLLRADGAHTCRDIAFLLHRSLFAITVEVCRLLTAGHLEVQPQPAMSTDAAQQPALPRRRRGASGINDAFPPSQPRSRLAVEVTRPPAGRKSERTR